MSEETDSNQPLIYQVTAEVFEQRLKDIKFDDLTKSQVERERTERIKALAQVIAAIAPNLSDRNNSDYSNPVQERFIDMCGILTDNLRQSLF